MLMLRVLATAGPLDLPLWSVGPFVLLLLAIAILPLLAEHFWHRNRNKLLVSALLAAPVAGYLIYLGPASTAALSHEIQQYASFIILLAALYTVSGGIVLQGDIPGRPLTNAAFLASGAVLANFIGTTGASILLIRAVLRINKQRQNTRHLPVFFIILVSNLGGLLTPLGDPPLFLGFLNGVDFFWTLSLWPQWLTANGAVLLIFLIWDTIAFRRETPEAIRREIRHFVPLRLKGLINLVFLAGILAAALFQSEKVAAPCRDWIRGFLPGCPELLLQKPWGEIVMLAMALLSLALTPSRLRHLNGFTWGPLLEVAILFAGIFVTMVPALHLLAAHGHEFGVTAPWQYFWLTGLLSSFLDNAPTYMVFATLAAGSPEAIGGLAGANPRLLEAISCGAVFMGANTYIGNGPNFMVKAIADEAGFRMPTFVGYLVYSSAILLPVFAVVTVVFFGIR